MKKWLGIDLGINYFSARVNLFFIGGNILRRTASVGLRLLKTVGYAAAGFLSNLSPQCARYDKAGGRDRSTKLATCVPPQPPLASWFQLRSWHRDRVGILCAAHRARAAAVNRCATIRRSPISFTSAFFGRCPDHRSSPFPRTRLYGGRPSVADRSCAPSHRGFGRQGDLDLWPTVARTAGVACCRRSVAVADREVQT